MIDGSGRFISGDRFFKSVQLTIETFGNNYIFVLVFALIIEGYGHLHYAKSAFMGSKFFVLIHYWVATSANERVQPGNEIEQSKLN